ncbi:Pseudouridine synthase I, TruA, C-terminal [Sesbania bispinosa]|nr:Pseudouridine synthase I, TruA, C-terminal [Sesbania bispinosa]
MATSSLRVPLFLPLFKKAPFTVAPTIGRSILGQFRCCSSPPSWQPFRKKKVVMRVAYVGTNYRGLQMQRDEHSLSTIEKELETAIFKAGGIRDSNFGDLQKIGWARSSRTDKGVHSLATVISFKMEIPETLGMETLMALPLQIMSFDPRLECILRKYFYLLPAETIGIQNHSSNDDIDYHLSEFNDILKEFEGIHPFHNYTARSRYRKHSPRRQPPSKGGTSARESLPAYESEYEDSDGEENLKT